MSEATLSFFYAQFPEALGCGMFCWLYFDDHLCSCPQVHLIDVYVEVRGPLIDGDHQPALHLSISCGTVDKLVASIEPESPLRYLSRAIDHPCFEETWIFYTVILTVYGIFRFEVAIILVYLLKLQIDAT